MYKLRPYASYVNCAIVVRMYVINKQPNDNTMYLYIYIYRFDYYFIIIFILYDWLNEIYIHNRVGRVDARNAVV